MPHHDPDTRGTSARRRGAVLEAALLDAAWEELLEKGYDRVTMEAVADRARTSRAVLHRRWGTKPELVQAVIVRAGALEPPVHAPDTGSLRGDVVALLREANERRARIGLQMMLGLGGYYAETGTSLGEVRDALLTTRPDVMQRVLDTAAERGEIATSDLPRRVAAVPFDLFRQELLMTGGPVSADAIDHIVDEVFLPLVARTRPG